MTTFKKIEGWTALHEAAFGGYEEIVSALLGAGATKTLRNKVVRFYRNAIKALLSGKYDCT